MRARSGASQASSRCCSHPREALVADLDLLDGDLVAARVQGGARVLDGPPLIEAPGRDRRAAVVDQRDAAVGARLVGTLLDDLLAPLPDVEGLVDAALERDVRPLDLARHLARDRTAVVVDRLVLDDRRL